MKIIIAGGRDFTNYQELRAHCDYFLEHKPDIEIVSGGARGADKNGEKYAEFEGYKITVFKADWDKHGKAAGIIRNRQMAEYADGLIAFWDGKSRGTKNMIDTAKELKLKIRIVKY